MPVYVAVAAPVIIATVAAATQPWLPPSHVLRDSQVIAAAHGDASPAYGLLSNLGVVVIAIATGMALLGWLVGRRNGDPLGSLLAWSFALSLAFVLDDLLLLHEAASVTSWGSIAVAAVYGAAFLVYLARFQEVVRERFDGGLLFLAIAAFGGSAVVDVLVRPTQTSVLLEDGAKLLGIVAWSVFVGRAALTAIRPARPRAGESEPANVVGAAEEHAAHSAAASPSGGR